mgnify:CR=1 FL=1
MIANSLINPIIPTLKLSDTVSLALDWMDEFGVKQLAITDEDQYKGIVSESILLDIPEQAATLEEIIIQHQDVYARDDQHIYELLNIIHEFGLTIIPVLDNESKFIGSIAVNELVERFASILGVKEKGAVVVLKIPERDYSLSEVSRLIESNDVKILSSVYSNFDPIGTIQVPQLTLKLNKTNITPLIATLERFGYDIIEAHANDPIDNVDQERLDMLLRYLAT